MKSLERSEICYLVAFPDPVETPSPAGPVTGLKDAPYFQPVDIRVHNLGQETIVVDEVEVGVTRQRYDDRIQFAECHYRLPDVLSPGFFARRQALDASLQERLVPEAYRASGLFEVYSILLVQDEVGSPDKFVDENAESLARFIRSQREVLDDSVIGEILFSRIRYSKNDLTLVDWEAALIFAPQGDFQSDIELLKIGNYQLLRYRMLSQSTEDMLFEISREFKQKQRSTFGLTRSRLRDIVNHRLDLMLDFEHNEQNLLLIGDWYTAKLYNLISDEFYLPNWKQAVQTKLDNLESIIGTIQENFSLSWRALMENVQLAGWLLLLIGYFILFFKDVFPAGK